jgi:hypothetical protein
MRTINSFELEALLASQASPNVLFLNNGNDARAEMAGIQRQMQAIQDRANGQRRALTAEETAEVESLYASFTIAESRLAIEDRANPDGGLYQTRAQADRANRGTGRQTQLAAPGDVRRQMNRGNVVTMETVVNHPRIREVADGTINHSGQIPLPGIRELLREFRNSVLTGEPPDDSPATTYEYEVQPRRFDRFGNDPRWALSLLSNLPVFPMTYSNELEYPLLTGDESEADYQSHEGATKPSVALPTELQSAKVYTFAAWMRASKQVLSDVALLTPQIQSLLRYKVLKKIEKELVNGVAKVNGLLNLATLFASEFSSPVDMIGDAASNLATAGWNPDLVVLSPNTWFRIRSERTTEEGGHAYVGGNWSEGGGIWGLRRAVTPAIADNTAIVLDSSAVAVLDRMQATLIVEGGGHENTVRNLVTLLAEARCGLAAFSPEAIKKVDLTEEEE